MTSRTLTQRNSSMYDALPKRLATLRRSKAMSQEELANILGVSRQAVSKWERGESSPDTLNLIGLADLYEMSLDELVRGAAIQEQTSSPTPENLITPPNAATQDCNSQIREGFEASDNPSQAVNNSTATVTESATDGVVKVEVVTTTIPLEAATSFMPKTTSKADSTDESNSNASGAAKPQAPSQPESNTNSFSTSADTITSTQAPSLTSQPQMPAPKRTSLPKDPHAYPPPTDTAYELPVTPPSTSFPHAQTPYTPPTPSAPGHFQPGSQEPVAHQHKHKQHEPKGALTSFPYPILCVILYLAFGYLFNSWHPGWIIFLTVPIYYWIAGIIEKDPIYQLRKQQREALIRGQINLIEQNSVNPVSGPDNEYPPIYQ